MSHWRLADIKYYDNGQYYIVWCLKEDHTRLKLLPLDTIKAFEKALAVGKHTIEIGNKKAVFETEHNHHYLIDNHSKKTELVRVLLWFYFENRFQQAREWTLFKPNDCLKITNAIHEGKPSVSVTIGVVKLIPLQKNPETFQLLFPNGNQTLVRREFSESLDSGLNSMSLWFFFVCNFGTFLFACMCFEYVL